MNREFQWMPPDASTMAGRVDDLYIFLVILSGTMTLLIAGLIAYFSIRYRRRTDTAPPPLRTVYSLEITWTVLPLAVFMVIFWWGADVYVAQYSPPDDTMEIYVIGKQWMWKVQHPEGPREINELHVPLHQPVELILSSQDVIHSFFVPAFRIKHDVLPGRYTSLWFEATEPGEYHLFCTEYCGAGHSRMVGRVVVMKPADYEAWLAGTYADEPPARSGEKLFISLGCQTCHGQQGPTLAGLYGREVRLADGSTVLADENYLRESILDAPAKLSAGFPPIMPSYRGQITDDQLLHLLVYIKSLGQVQPGEVRKP